MLTRYLAAVAVASFASRDDDAEAKLSELSGNLSFGHFLTTVQEVVGAKGNHPAQPLLAHAFKATKRNKDTVRGKTDAALVSLLGLRNDLGHELRNLDEAKAAAVEAASAPAALLVEALDGVEAVLSKPLFVVEDQQWTREALVVRRLLLMGESSDPAPQSIKVGHETGGVGETRTPYLAINRICLQLPPWLLWGIDHGRQNFALLFLDAVEDARARYCTIDGSEQHQGDGIAESIRQLFAGVRRAADAVVLIDGRHLASEWADTRKQIEESGRRQDGLVDWLSFEPATIKWFADASISEGRQTRTRRFGSDCSTVDTRSSPTSSANCDFCLDALPMVRSELQRDVLDLRVIDPVDDAARQRQAGPRRIGENLLEALKRAVQFFARRPGWTMSHPEDLRKTEGSLDYLTLREIFVNQAVHQDYRDASAAGQIEIHQGKVTVFNTGYSLVPTDTLLDGGKSQSRNPLIARALRLIGFAEIAGSGIRAVHRACQQARRRAPDLRERQRTPTPSR